MECTSVLFSGDAVTRMFERGLHRRNVTDVLSGREVIAAYPDDRPFPSYLLLGFPEGRPIHLVAARDPASGRCIVVTVYRPDPQKWADEFRTRRQ